MKMKFFDTLTEAFAFTLTHDGDLKETSNGRYMVFFR